MTILDNPDLILRLERCRDLPSPPGVAEQIIALSSDPNSNISALANVVSLDPALTVKILRMANSSMYARAANVESLEQAVMMFGWNGTLNLALSFSLVSSVTSDANKGLDHDLFWKRSISAAVSAEHLAKIVGLNKQKSDLFLPGLLQDIGMLALDKAAPEVYENISENQYCHVCVQDIEKDKLGVDHASVGAWLLERWNLPQRIIDLVAISHNKDIEKNHDGLSAEEKCIEVSNIIADCICNKDDEKDYVYAAKICDQVFGLDKNAFLENLELITQEITETATVFELDVGDPRLLNCIAEQAKELLLLRSMDSLKTAEGLHQEAEFLESKAKRLEDTVKIDPLTQIYNRGYLETTLDQQFQLAQANNSSLAVIMADLDHFKRINDSHGHACGDKALKYAVELLQSCTRDTDSLFRYGGEEFVIVLPNGNDEGAESLARRIIEKFNSNVFKHEDKVEIKITISLGIAIHGVGINFDNSEHLLNVADYCLYASKAEGRNRYTLYNEKDLIKAAVG